MIPGVSVALANGQIGGSLATNDKVVGAVLTGAGAGTLGLLTPVKVVSVDDAKAKGITLAAEPEAYKFVTDFYSIDGTLGLPLWLMLAANTATLVSLCDVNNASGIKKLIDAVNGTIRVISVSRTPAVGYVPTVGHFLDQDCILAATNAQAFAVAKFAQHTPVRILIAARVADIASQVIEAPNTMTNNRVGFVIGGTANDGHTSTGIVLGRVAATEAHTNLGRVKDGDLPINSWFIGSRPIAPDPAAPMAAWYQQLDQLIDAGFITVKSYPQKAGYFISGDPMAVAESDDYNSLANGRVIDKASIIAYQTFLNSVNDDVDLDDNNNIEPVVLKALEGEIVNALTLNMGDSMSGDAVVFIDDTQQITANATLKVKLRIRRKGYLKVIEVDLGFYSPQTN